MNEQKTRPEEVSIHIDKNVYRVHAGSLSGAQLRALASPPISGHYDLYLEVPGGDDRLVADDVPIELRSGMHFFSAPANITPGR